MLRTVWTSLVVVAALGTGARAKDAPAPPEGVSVQTFGDHTFVVAVPKAADAKPPYSLLLVVSGKLAVDPDFVPFTKDGYVVVAPKQKLAGGMWATSEAKDILDYVAQIEGPLQIAKDRTHLLTVEDDRGFATFVAFDKRAQFVSYSLVGTVWQGQSPPGDARKRLGVLSMGTADVRRGDPAKIVETLAGKVRTVEYRSGEGPFGKYFRYWLGVMEGRFRPGYDLSLDWIADPDAPAPAAKPGAKDAAPPAKPALDEARATSKSAGIAGLVYFWSADDAAKPEAKALQNEVFFDPELRAAAKRGVAVKLDRAKYQEAFAAFGLKSTPAVVVVDKDFAPVERFEGAFAAKALVKALAKAAPAKSK